MEEPHQACVAVLECFADIVIQRLGLTAAEWEDLMDALQAEVYDRTEWQKAPPDGDVRAALQRTISHLRHSRKLP